jgi:hypothetical protein
MYMKAKNRMGCKAPAVVKDLVFIKFPDFIGFSNRFGSCGGCYIAVKISLTQ